MEPNEVFLDRYETFLDVQEKDGCLKTNHPPKTKGRVQKMLLLAASHKLEIMTSSTDRQTDWLLSRPTHIGKKIEHNTSKT